MLLRGTTGIAYADSLTARYPGLRVIFMTSARDEEQPLLEAALARGQLLHKPFTTERLLESIQMSTE